MKITWVILCHRFLTCRRKDNICILKNLEVSGFLTSKINASNLKASRCYTNHQVQYMGNRAFCFETAAQSWASDLVSLVWPSGFSLTKRKRALISQNHFGFDSLWIQWFVLKCLKKDQLAAQESWMEFFFKIFFSFPYNMPWQTTLTTCHWVTEETAPHFLSTLTSFLWETLKDISDG